jgi:hypothetical protein
VSESAVHFHAKHYPFQPDRICHEKVTGKEHCLIAVNLLPAHERVENALAFPLTGFGNNIHQNKFFDFFLRVAKGVPPGLIDVEKASLRGNPMDKVAAMVKQAGIEFYLFLEDNFLWCYGMIHCCLLFKRKIWGRSPAKLEYCQLYLIAKETLQSLLQKLLGGILLLS